MSSKPPYCGTWRTRRGYDIKAIGNGIREDLTIARCGRGERVEGGDSEVWGRR